VIRSRPVAFRSGSKNSRPEGASFPGGRVDRSGSRLTQRLVHASVLSVLAFYVLVLFVTPVERHAGINDHPEALFHDMLSGSAGKPAVTRVLVPWAIRVLDLVTPTALPAAIRDWVSSHPGPSAVFARLHWAPGDAWHYLVTSVLLWLCFVLFAHAAATLALATTPVRYSPALRTVLAGLALLGLPPLFRYTTFLYDPPQLLLFTMAFLAIQRGRYLVFAALFALAALNKETALLLLPVWVLNSNRSARETTRGVVVLLSVYVLLRLLAHGATLAAPGPFLRLRLFDHNIPWLIRGYSFTEMTTAGLLGASLLLSWNEKSRLLKTGLVSILPPLLLAGFFFGFLNEWRDYLEAYPVGFALAVDSGARVVAAISSFSRRPGSPVSPGTDLRRRDPPPPEPSRPVRSRDSVPS
jgi:hypothetical protein